MKMSFKIFNSKSPTSDLHNPVTMTTLNWISVRVVVYIYSIITLCDDSLSTCSKYIFPWVLRFITPIKTLYEHLLEITTIANNTNELRLSCNNGNDEVNSILVLLTKSMAYWLA